MAENIPRLIKGHQKQEQFLTNKLDWRLEIILSTETDTEYFQRLQATNNWSKNCS